MDRKEVISQAKSINFLAFAFATSDMGRLVVASSFRNGKDVSKTTLVTSSLSWIMVLCS
jgi:hypothetical protein